MVTKLNINKAAQKVRPEKFENLFLFEVTGSHGADTHYIFEECSVLLCLDGEGRLFINEKEYIYSSHTIFIIPPNYLLRKEECLYRLHAKTLFFPIDFITDYTDNYNLKELVRKVTCIQVPEEQMSELLEFYSFLEKQYNKSTNIFSAPLLSNLLLVFLIKMMEILSGTNMPETYTYKTNKTWITDRFFELVSLHYKEERSLTFYADKLCLTPKYLSFVVKQTTGRPALTWINDFVILKAKVLLKTTQMSLSEVTDALNLPNQSFFGRLFKKYTGMTPGDYRKA